MEGLKNTNAKADFSLDKPALLFSQTQKITSFDINEALELLAVGMGTVFFILALVVFMGTQLINVVNRWMPAPVLSKVSAPASSSGSAIQPGVIAAIVGAVDIVTEGKGKVDHVERADN